MGSSNVVNVCGLRVAGISGIYKKYDFERGFYETFPFDHDEIKSVYHQREFDVMKLSLVIPTVLNMVA